MFRAAVVSRLCRAKVGGCDTVPYSARTMCSKRHVPVFSPWRARKHKEMDKFFRDFPTRSPFRAFDEGMRDVMDRAEKLWPFYERDFHERSREGRSAEALEVKYDHKVFEVNIDASHFDPEELSVKINGDRLFIKGKHEQKADEHGYVAREFSREFIIPEDVDQDTMSSRFTDDGMLVVRAKVKGADESKGKEINIERDLSQEQDKS